MLKKEYGITSLRLFGSIVEMNELKGDVNGDMGVDEADIASVISVMAGGTSIPYAQADVNGDGKVDVADITTLIKMIAGQK
jgi:hypothetical protein